MPPFRASRSARAALLALSALLALGLAGCQTGPGADAGQQQPSVPLAPLSELTPTPDPRAVEGPTTAVIGGPSVPPLGPGASPELPVTVVSRDGAAETEVTVADASRILAISLTGSLAELVYAYGLGDHLVGRDISTNLPGTEDLPVVTKAGHTIDAESVIALRPSVILTDGTIGPTDVVLQLRDAGIPVVTVTRAVDPDRTYQSAREVAAALGIAPRADELVSVLREAIAVKTAEIARLTPDDPARLPRVAFLYVRGTAGIFYLFGEGSGIDSMIDSLGAIDVAREIGWVGERPLTAEALVAINPDIILVMTKGLDSAGGVDGLIAAQPSIALTSAGQHRRIVDVDDTLLFAGGTRIPDVLDGLARAIYAPDSLAG